MTTTSGGVQTISTARTVKRICGAIVIWPTVFRTDSAKRRKACKRAKAVIDPATVPVPPYYPDIPEVREEIAHHYDCLLKTDQEIGDLLDQLEKDGLPIRLTFSASVTTATNFIVTNNFYTKVAFACRCL